jgi:hypothetical protein
MKQIIIVETNNGIGHGVINWIIALLKDAGYGNPKVTLIEDDPAKYNIQSKDVE